MKLPNNFLELPAEEQRRIIVERHAERFEQGDTDAGLDLLMAAVTHDPDIPESTKVNLRAKLIQTLNGSGTIDPLSPDRRRAEYDDMQVYGEVMRAGGSYTDAVETVAKQRNVSAATIRRAYDRHVKRWPDCRRLDGRRK
jgi:hypothetical protein